MQMLPVPRQVRLTLIAAASLFMLPSTVFAQSFGGAFEGMQDRDQPIQIEFLLLTDGDGPNGDGFYLDDFTVDD